MKIFSRIFLFFVITIIGMVRTPADSAVYFVIPTEHEREFGREVEHTIVEIREKDLSREFDRETLNPVECGALSAYSRTVLLRLVNRSALQAAAANLYFSLTCTKGDPHELRAGVRGHTLKLGPEIFSLIESEDALAFALAHELAHHVLRHEEKRAAQGIELLKDLSSERFAERDMLKQSQELEADHFAIRIAANAGYSILGGVELMRKLAALYAVEDSKTTVSTEGHESPDERARIMRAKATAIGIRPGPTKAIPNAVRAAAIRYRLQRNVLPESPARVRLF